MDEVDRIVAAWQAERPDVDFEPMQVLSRVTRLARRLDAVRSKAFATAGLHAWEFDVLTALRRAGQSHSLSPGALAQETLVTSGTMTNRIDRLVEHGYVTRSQAPSDRRGVVVHLTGDGRRAVDAAMDELLSSMDDLLDGMSATDRTQVAQALRQVLGRFS